MVVKIGDVEVGRVVEISRGGSYFHAVIVSQQAAVTQVREIVRPGYGQTAGRNDQGVYYVETPLDGVRTYFEPFALSADTNCTVTQGMNVPHP